MRTLRRFVLPPVVTLSDTFVLGVGTIYQSITWNGNDESVAVLSLSSVSQTLSIEQTCGRAALTAVEWKEPLMSFFNTITIFISAGHRATRVHHKVSTHGDVWPTSLCNLASLGLGFALLAFISVILTLAMILFK